MDINSLNSVTSSVMASYNKNEATPTEEKKQENTSGFTKDAAVYEKSNSDRSGIVAMIKADQEKIQSQLYDIVKKTVGQQMKTFSLTDKDLWSKIANGEFTASEDQIAQAKKDIADDGYWGVDQTSSRIVDFAIALSGNDTKYADKLLSAFEKGFKEATGLWGKDLPDISSKTAEAVRDKFQQWKDGTYKNNAKTEEQSQTTTKTEE